MEYNSAVSANRLSIFCVPYTSEPVHRSHLLTKKLTVTHRGSKRRNTDKATEMYNKEFKIQIVQITSSDCKIYRPKYQDL